ncbi:MAG TPA: thiamine phosphate synthase [Vicinamibacteria bacterium]
MTAPAVYVIADRGAVRSHEEWLDAIAELAASGAALQIRGKEASLEERAAAVRAALAGGGQPFLNGASDEARAAGAWGVHWPEAQLPDGPERRGLYAAGASVHSLLAAQRAAAAGADFVVFGPVFDPGSKPGRGVGLEALARVAAGSPLPVLAVGGVTPERVGACRAAGAAGVAVVSGILAARDRAAAVDSYRAAWRAALEGVPCR